MLVDASDHFNMCSRYAYVASAGKVAELRGDAIGTIEHTLMNLLMEPVVAIVTSIELVLYGFELDHIEGVLTSSPRGGWCAKSASARSECSAGTRLCGFASGHGLSERFAGCFYSLS